MIAITFEAEEVVVKASRDGRPSPWAGGGTAFGPSHPHQVPHPIELVR